MSGTTNYSDPGVADPYADPSSWSVSGYIDAATGVNTSPTFNVPKTPDTATTNAIQSMAPVTAQNTNSGSASSGFWSQVGGALGNALNGFTNLAVKNNGIPVRTTVVPTPALQQNELLVIGGLIVVALVLTHKAG